MSVTITTLNTIEEFVNFIGSPKLSVVHFFAPWADQCRQVTEVLKELSKLPIIQSNGTIFAICEAENLAEISLKNKIESVPTVILFKNGAQVDRVDGADSAQITSKVKLHTIGKVALAMEGPKLNLETRLKALINKHTVMAFIKGTRDAPKCGFTRTLIQILNSTGVEYDTFDILSDEEVRQGLKEYSDWPTYPQLYIKGELVGGLDIVKELQANGELEPTLNC